MTDPRESSLTDWEEPLARALDRCGAADPPVLFAEERLDLRVELLPDRPPSSIPSLWRGLAARGSAGRGPVAFQADPSPDDASRLVRLASNPAPRYPRVEERKERRSNCAGRCPNGS